MAATILLAAGNTKTISDEFEVAAGASVAVGLFSNGVKIPGDISTFKIQRKNVLDIFEDFSTIKYGYVRLDGDATSFIIEYPGIYRICRPDISGYGVEVGIEYEVLVAGATASGSGWSRPADWLAMSDLEVTDDKIEILATILPGTTANYIAFTLTGNYTVDWGDGNTENIASGVKAEHQYDETQISADTLTEEGFKQAIITITPNGSPILTADFTRRHSSINASNTYSPTLIREIRVNCPSITSFRISEWYSVQVSSSNTQRVVLGANSITDMSGLFAYMYGMREVVITGSMINVLTVESLFDSNYALSSVIMPEDLSNCTTFDYMFAYCYSITEVPYFDMSSATSVRAIFTSCYGIKTLPLYDMSSVADFYRFFIDKENWSIAPYLDTSSGTNFSQFFAYSYPLVALPNYDFSNNTNSLADTFGWGWSGSVGLKKVDIIGINSTIIFANALLDRDNIVNIFNNLATVVGQTITISGNPGVADLTGPDIAIATDKGWTVVT